MRIVKMIQEFIGENKVYGEAVNGVQKDLSECTNPDEKPNRENIESLEKTKKAVLLNG